MGEVPVPLVRANQIFIAGAVVLAAALRQPWIVVAEFAVVAAAFVLGPRGHLIMRAAGALLRRSLPGAATEDARVQRFNQMLASIMLAAATVCLLAGASVAGWLIAGLLAAVAAAGALGFCLGCRLYRVVGPVLRLI